MTAYRRIEDVPLLRYNLIMADPPWRFQSWSENGNARSPQAHYSCMALDEIKSLPISTLAGRDCWLWLWATGAMLDEAAQVRDAWGFRRVTTGAWGKVTRSMPVRPRIGVGHVLRECCEYFLIGKIGDPPVLDRGIPSLILAPKREHSRKPDQAYDYAERLAGPHAWRLDLFSRQERRGWDCCGDQHDQFSAGDAA